MIWLLRIEYAHTIRDDERPAGEGWVECPYRPSLFGVGRWWRRVGLYWLGGGEGAQ